MKCEKTLIIYTVYIRIQQKQYVFMTQGPQGDNHMHTHCSLSMGIGFCLIALLSAQEVSH